MKIKLGIKRYLIFFVGLFINSFGVSFVTKACMGTSPISSIPYTLSLILVVLQMIILGKKFPKSYLLQIPFSFLFSWFIDCTMEWLGFMNPGTYFQQIVMLLLGCGILGFGVYLEDLADVVMLPGEAFVSAVSKTFRFDFGKTKIEFDSTMAAILVGMIARFFVHKCDIVGRLFFREQVSEIEEAFEE